MQLSVDATMGVRSANHTRLVAVINPTCMKIRSLNVKCSDHVVKSYPLGHGQYTLGGNCGHLTPSMTYAHMKGYDDVMYLLDDYV